MFWHLVIFALVARCVGSDKTSKTWLQNTNFNNRDNWNKKRVPCRADRVIFPSSADVTIALPSGQTILREMILPFNGDILLPSSGNLVLTGSAASTAGCGGGDVEFIRTEAHAWFDPSNWLSNGKNQDKSPVPHAERIPCSYDEVVFPEGNSFKVKLPDVSVSVGSMLVDGKGLTEQSWTEFLFTDPGRNQFRGQENTVTVKESGCDDVTGCICATNPKELKVQVCKYEKERCEEPACYSSVQPVGHCCSICGAYMLLNFNSQFIWSKLRQAIQGEMQRKENKEFEIYLSKISTEQVQVVVAESGDYKGESKRLINDLASRLRSDENLGVNSLSLHASGAARHPWSRQAGIAVTVFFVVLIILAVAALLVYRRRRGLSLFGSFGSRSFVFARFENDGSGGEGQLEFGGSRVEGLSTNEVDEPTNQAFDNPMYDKPSQVLAEPSVRMHEVLHENPVYSALEEAKEASEKVLKDEIGPSEEDVTNP